MTWPKKRLISAKYRDVTEKQPMLRPFYATCGSCAAPRCCVLRPARSASLHRSPCPQAWEDFFMPACQPVPGKQSLLWHKLQQLHCRWGNADIGKFCLTHSLSDTFPLPCLPPPLPCAGVGEWAPVPHPGRVIQGARGHPHRLPTETTTGKF